MKREKNFTAEPPVKVLQDQHKREGNLRRKAFVLSLEPREREALAMGD